MGDEQVKLLDDAIKVLKPSDDFDTAITAYNLACAHALLGDAKTAKHYLLEWNQAGTLPDRKHLESDRDMDLVRNCAWFKEMITDL